MPRKPTTAPRADLSAKRTAPKPKSAAKAPKQAAGGKKRLADPKIAAIADRAERRSKGEPVHPESGYDPLHPPVAVPVKRPAWRPSGYRREFCEQVIEYGRMGKSRTWMAANLGITTETLYDWSRKYPEFSDALAYAKGLEQAHWEDLGHSGLTTPCFGQSVWSRSMAARFPKEWREKSAVAVSGDEDGPPVKHEVGLRWMTQEEAKARGWA
jgi:hypothetical protein